MLMATTRARRMHLFRVPLTWLWCGAPAWGSSCCSPWASACSGSEPAVLFLTLRLRMAGLASASISSSLLLDSPTTGCSKGKTVAPCDTHTHTHTHNYTQTTCSAHPLMTTITILNLDDGDSRTKLLLGFDKTAHGALMKERLNLRVCFFNNKQILLNKNIFFHS